PELPAGALVEIAAAEPTAELPKEIAPAPSSAPNSRRAVEGDFGHDDDHRWLQGVLERHYRGYFCVRYCDPSVEDEFGGKVRLQDDERLAAFHDGDIIALSGDLLRRDSN